MATSIYRVLGCLLYLNCFKQRFMPQFRQVALVDQNFASMFDARMACEILCKVLCILDCRT